MNDFNHHRPEILNAMHDAAHAQAEALRREALADFWRGTDQLLGQAWQRSERAARRLAHRLRGHRAGRGIAGNGTPCGT